MIPLMWEVTPRDWNEERWKHALFLTKQFTVQVLVPIALQIVNIAKTIVSTQYPPASASGEPPHRRTGFLQENIDLGEITTHGVTVRSKAPYSRALDMELPKCNQDRSSGHR
mgnify:CR=1 FL=1